ncbi:TonB family protein [Thermovibrio sp.]
MRSSLFPYFFSLLIHALFICALVSWSSQLPLKRKPVEVSIPVELAWEIESPAKVQSPKPPKRAVKKAVRTPKPRPTEPTVKRVSHRPVKRVVKSIRAQKLKRKAPAFKHRSVEKAPPKPQVKSVSEKEGLKGKVKVSESPRKTAGKTEFQDKPETPKGKDVPTPALTGSEESHSSPPPPFNPEDYKRLVVAVLQKNKFYPPLARRLGIEGVVDVEITFDRSGKPVDVRVLNSPPAILKRAAVKLIRGSSFPPLPDSYRGERLTVKVEIAYRLVD